MSLESHARRPQKSSENKLQLELKNIKITFLKILKT